MGRGAGFAVRYPGHWRTLFYLFAAGITYINFFQILAGMFLPGDSPPLVLPASNSPAPVCLLDCNYNMAQAEARVCGQGVDSVPLPQASSSVCWCPLFSVPACARPLVLPSRQLLLYSR